MTESQTPPAQTPGFSWLSGWSRILLDMFAITFGVLLAFTLNEWWTRRNTAERVERSVANIMSELDRNAASLERAYDYRLEIYPRILDMLSGEMRFQDVRFRGTQPPQIERAAYDVAISTGTLSEVDPGTAEAIVGAYLSFDRIMGTHRTYSSGLPSLIFQSESPDDPRGAIYLQMAFQDFIYAETAGLNHLAEMEVTEAKPPAWEVISGFMSEAETQAAAPTAED